MGYVVMEIQTMDNGTIANIVTQHETEAEAYSKFHAVLSAAAISDLPCHGALIITGDCVPLDYQCYRHSEVA